MIEDTAGHYFPFDCNVFVVTTFDRAGLFAHKYLHAYQYSNHLSYHLHYHYHYNRLNYYHYHSRLTTPESVVEANDP